ncbi:MAG: hypothetical protein QOI08_1483, partial [Actinomycetota bacterium]|nr:hypothetical protein [Actinomycetota bacterium]
PGYQLQTDNIDAARFEDLLTRARVATDVTIARAALEEALALWRGDAYAEFAHEDWAIADARRLAELRVGAIEDLAELLLAAREWTAALATVQPLIETEPFRDRPRGLLMRALADSGRRTDALRAFQAYRTYLIDEIGTEPSAAIVALDRDIASCGASQLSQLSHNLPAPVSSFIGRDVERAAVAKFVGEHRLVTLTGTGGCGKTRLALRAATDLVDSHRGGTWWVELASATAPGEVAERVAFATGFIPGAGLDVTAQIVRHLRDAGPVLLVLDNAEHLLDAVAQLALAMLSGCADARVLVTSREPLDMPGELIWRVPSMAVPEPDEPVGMEFLESFDATRLFLERARLAEPDLIVDDTTVPAIVSICARLDGLPLALELAAARVRSMSLDHLASGLDDSFRPLAVGFRTVIARHQTLQASIAWSIDLLEDLERAVLERLAVFRSSFTADAARNVAADDAVDAAAVINALGHLVDKSLAQLDNTTGRYRILETIRQFCLEPLRGTAELDATRARHANHYAQWCTEVGDGHHGIERGPILLEMPDVVAAMEWSREHSAVHALRMCAGLASMRTTLGHYGNLVETWDWLLAFDRDGDLAAEWATAVAALMASATGARVDLSGLVADVEPRLPLANIRARGWLARGNAMVPAYRGDLAPMIAYAEAIVAAQDDVEISIYAGFTAYMLSLMGRLGEAERWIDAQREMARRQRAPFTVDTVGNGYAAAIVIATHRGQSATVTRYASAASPKDPAFSMTAAAALAQAALMTGDRALLDDARRWSKKGTIPLLRFLIASIDLTDAMFEGDLEAAANAAERYWDEAAPVPVSRVALLSTLNVPLLEAGRLAAAERITDDSAALVRAMPDAPLGTALIHQSRAQQAVCAGRDDEAEAQARVLLDVACEHGYVLMIVDALEVLAVLAGRAGAPDVASCLLDAAITERERLGYRLVMLARAKYDDLVATTSRPTEPFTIAAAVEYARHSV